MVHPSLNHTYPISEDFRPEIIDEEKVTPPEIVALLEMFVCLITWCQRTEHCVREDVVPEQNHEHVKWC